MNTTKTATTTTITPRNIIKPRTATATSTAATTPAAITQNIPANTMTSTTSYMSVITATT